MALKPATARAQQNVPGARFEATRPRECVLAFGAGALKAPVAVSTIFVRRYVYASHMKVERETGLKPATSALAR